MDITFRDYTIVLLLLWNRHTMAKTVQQHFTKVSAVLWIVFKTNRKWDEPTNTFPASLLYLENTFEVSLVNIRRYYKRLISGINLVIDDISRNTDMFSRCRTANCLVQVNTVNGALDHNRIHPQGIELHRCGLNGCNYLALSAAKVQTHRATHPQWAPRIYSCCNAYWAEF